MNIRYGKAFKIPRKIVKFILSEFIYPIIIKIYPLPKVKTIDETLKDLLEKNKSIARFGDSEFLFIIDKLNLPYQKYEPRLAEIMKAALKSNDPRILIGLPIGYQSLDNLTKDSRSTWRSQIAWIYPRLKKYLRTNGEYHNASMTRPYMDYINKDKSEDWFLKLRKLWQNREVILVEGEKSRLGVGNNLFDNVISLKRIIGPAHNGFSSYDKLKNEVLKQEKHKLILIAMGPTATAMAYELTLEGYQCLDIGNVDIEYEWYLRKAKNKIKVPGKYTSEAKGGRVVEDVKDEIYHSQIIASYIN